MNSQESLPRIKILSIIIFISIIFLLITCDNGTYPSSYPEEHELLVVYPNSGNELYFVDYYSYEIQKELTITTKDSLYLQRLCVSTNKDYLIFIGTSFSEWNNPAYLVIYDISLDSVTSVFKLGLNSIAAPRLHAAQISDEPDMIYLYSHNNGLFAINFLSQRIKLISLKKDYPKLFYKSPNSEWFIVNSYYPSTQFSFSYSELEFYEVNSRLKQLDFILNEHDEDSINVKDMVFSEEENILYISYLLSQKKAIREACYFGSYDLKTYKFNEDVLVLPWSNNPYYIAHNSQANECYLIGENNLFYVIALDSTKYYIKDTIELSSKTPGPSRIIVNPSNDVAFVSCFNDNKVYVIDLVLNEIVKELFMNKPYYMVLI